MVNYSNFLNWNKAFYPIVTFQTLRFITHIEGNLLSFMIEKCHVDKVDTMCQEMFVALNLFALTMANQWRTHSGLESRGRCFETIQF